jgi:hypothetical protein
MQEKYLSPVTIETRMMYVNGGGKSLIQGNNLLELFILVSSLVVTAYIVLKFDPTPHHWVKALNM